MIDNSQRDLASSKQSPKIGRRKHFWPPKTELTRLYHELQWTLAKIASHFGVSKSLVQYWFKKYGISTRKRTGGHNKIPIPPKTELIRLYHQLRWSLHHIAKYYGVTKPTVRSWFRTYNISVRNLSEAHRIISMPSREVLIRQYHTQLWSLQQIANHYNVSVYTVQLWFAEFNIPRRSPVETRTIPSPPEEELIHFYYRLKWSIYFIARYYKVSDVVVRRWFKESGFEFREVARPAQNIPWDEWEKLCLHKIAPVLLTDRLWKDRLLIDTPQYSKKKFVVPEIVIYDNNGNIDEIIDAKWSHYYFGYKDIVIYPSLTIKKKVTFWLLHGESAVEIYFNNNTVTAIPYEDFDIKNFDNKDLDKILAFINADDIISTLQEQITPLNEASIIDIIDRVDQLRKSPNFSE